MPIADPSWIIVGLNQLYRHIARADVWFDIHLDWRAGNVEGTDHPRWLAECGLPVFMVEREPSIGGHMAQFDKTFPTLDCAACILTPKMSDVGGHPNIHLLSYSEVEEVTGYVGSFHVRLKKKAR